MVLVDVNVNSAFPPRYGRKSKFGNDADSDQLVTKMTNFYWLLHFVQSYTQFVLAKHQKFVRFLVSYLAPKQKQETNELYDDGSNKNRSFGLKTVKGFVKTVKPNDLKTNTKKYILRLVIFVSFFLYCIIRNRSYSSSILSWKKVMSYINVMIHFNSGNTNSKLQV